MRERIVEGGPAVRGWEKAASGAEKKKKKKKKEKEEEKEEEEEGREAEGKRRRRLLLLRGYTNIGTSRVNCRPLSRISAASCTARIHIYFAAAHIS